MLNAFLLLLGLQLAGDLLVGALGAPVPGMILGMALLLAILVLRGHWFGAARAIPTDLDGVAKGLHDHLGLLFVPAGAGIIAYPGLLGTDGPALLAAVVAGTAATIGLAGRIAMREPKKHPQPTTEVKARGT